MTRALRYASLEDLPPAMRARVELAQTRQRVAAEQGKPKHRPRHDAEHEAQVVFFNRIRALAANDARFAVAAARTYAIPNGGGRTPREAGRLKAEGVLKGVSDVFVSLPVKARTGTRHGLYIEMKSSTGRVSPEQTAWMLESARLGYATAVCWSADEAVSVWRTYVLAEDEYA